MGSSLSLTDCLDNAKPQPEQPETPPLDPELAQNPLVAPSPLPFGAPQFDKVKPEHFIPAIKHGIALQNQAIAAIIDNPAPPSFENTLEALERSGQQLSRVQRILSAFSLSSADPEIQEVTSEVSQLTAPHATAITQNMQLFKRVEVVYQNRANLELEARRLVEKYRDGFLAGGVNLDAASQQRIATLTSELSALSLKFRQNNASITKDEVLLIKDKAKLEGLSQAQLDGLKSAAKDAGHEEGYLIRLVNTTRHPLLSRLKYRPLRQELWELSAKRGQAQNGAIALDIVKKRNEQAQLLGHSTWADYVLSKSVAQNVDNVFDLMDPLAEKVLDKAKKDADKLRQLILEDGETHELEPWDWLYYSEKLRQKEYDLKVDELRPYFELDRVREEGMFYAMNQLFGVQFKERFDLPVYHPDVRVFDVLEADGTPLGLFYADDYARPGKRGGAWSSTWFSQSHLSGQRPIVANVLNIPKPPEGQPTLLTYWEVKTMYHELGHALHTLFSDVKYPSLSGTSVPRDYVEFPAQLQEDWSLHPQVVERYARHYETNEPIPQDLWDRFLAARNFNKGFNALEYIKASYLDLKWHSDLSEKDTSSVRAFEQQVFAELGLDIKAIPSRYRTPYFLHIFASGYSAGYYSYLWTELYAADAYEYIQANGGLTRLNGDRLRSLILSKGDSVDPLTQFINFRGAEPSVDPYLRRNGLDK